MIIKIIKMKFYDREAELKEFQTLSSYRPSFLVVTGKRRIGKTELALQHLKETKRGFYFFVDDKKSENILIKEFMEELKLFIPEYLKEVKSFDDFLLLLFDLSKKEPATFVFDEFQRFLKINPSIINQFQKNWDIKAKKSKAFLIITGSSVGMIKKIFVEEGAPLFKRADNILYLEPFTFAEIKEILKGLGIRTFEEQLKLYFLFGGIIYYYKLMEKYKVRSFEEAVRKLIVREFAPLRDEVKDTLIESFGREHRTYYEILNAIGMGKNTKKEMSGWVKVEETSLSPYLIDLKELVKAISYRLPVTEDPNRSKKGRYIISDNFFLFWFRFIFRNRNYYEQKKFAFIEELINKQKNDFFGKRYEVFCQEVLEKLNYNKKLPFFFETAGTWWGHRREENERKEIEIDLVALNGKTKQIMFGECKWQEKVDAHSVLSQLRKKAQHVPWHNQEREEYYILFAKSFRNKIKEPGVTLINLKDLGTL
ncbi:MAG: ATP-binding protein [Nanoarchaeota archaeon]